MGLTSGIFFFLFSPHQTAAKTHRASSQNIIIPKMKTLPKQTESGFLIKEEKCMQKKVASDWYHRGERQSLLQCYTVTKHVEVYCKTVLSKFNFKFNILQISSTQIQ